MNKIISIACSFCLILLLSACGDQAASNNNQSPSAKETAAKKAPKNPRVDANPVQGVIDRLQKNGVALSQEQIKAIEAKGSDYDFEGETRYEKRVKYKDFRNEVTQEILTETQQADLQQRTQERKASRKKKEK